MKRRRLVLWPLVLIALWVVFLALWAVLASPALAHPAPPPAVAPGAGLDEAGRALREYLAANIDEVAFRVIDQPADTASGIGRPVYLADLDGVRWYAETPTLVPPGVERPPVTRTVTLEVTKLRAYRGSLSGLPPAGRDELIPPARADLNDDGVVDASDLAELVAHWTPVNAADREVVTR